MFPLISLRGWLFLGSAAIAVALVTGGVWLLRHDAYEAGKAETTQEITDANRKVEGLADGASSRVTRCYGTGGAWDRTRGVCDYPAGR